MKKKKSRFPRQISFFILEFICVCLFVYAAAQLVFIIKDYRVASKEYDRLSEQILVIEEGCDDYIIVDSNEKENTTFPCYQKVNFDDLKLQNQDFVGWIILPNTKINYPIVKSEDNTEYLSTTFEGKKSNSGSIFMDMYCESDFTSTNTIIYGHNMKNGSMFRALNNLTDEAYYNENQRFCIDIGNGFEYYQIISCYATDETDNLAWQIYFQTANEYEEWLQKICSRCSYQCLPYDAEKNTITLSTCRGSSGGTGRFVVYLQKIK